MGKKIITEEEISRRICAAHNVKAYRKEKGWTQEDCAAEWGLSVLTIRRLELNAEPGHRGKYPATRKTARQIAEHTGIYWEYWYGLSGIKEKERYEAAIAEGAAIDAAIAEAEETEFSEYIKKVNRYREFFSTLGYRYENIEKSAAYDLSGIFPEQFGGKPLQPHNLTPINGIGSTSNLSDSQLNSIISYLKKQISFAVFELSNENKLENNNTGAV